MKRTGEVLALRLTTDTTVTVGGGDMRRWWRRRRRSTRKVGWVGTDGRGNFVEERRVV